MEAFVRDLLRPAFIRLGMTPKPGEPDEERTLRPVVIQALGVAGRDPDVGARARAALDASLDGREAMDPTAANAIIAVAAAQGDKTLYDRLVAAERRAQSPEERYRLLYALAHFRDPLLVTAGLHRVLTDDIRNQDAISYVARFLANPAINAQAWSFVKSEWSTLSPKLFIAMAEIPLTNSLLSFCDVSAQKDIRTFFDTHPLPTAGRALAQTLERMNQCIVIRERETGAVTAWLDANAPAR
jgi:hypothetical protein